MVGMGIRHRQLITHPVFKTITLRLIHQDRSKAVSPSLGACVSCRTRLDRPATVMIYDIIGAYVTFSRDIHVRKCKHAHICIKEKLVLNCV